MTQDQSIINQELGWWNPIEPTKLLSIKLLKNQLYQINQWVILVNSSDNQHIVVDKGNRSFNPDHDAGTALLPIVATASSCQINSMGDSSFMKDWDLVYPMVGGSMANGISSVELVTALAKAGMMGFYGAAGQSLQNIETAILKLKSLCANKPWGVNLIHNPQEPAMEDCMVDLLLKHDVNKIEASAYMTVTRALVRYRVTDIYRNKDGAIITPNKILAKASRIEIATMFLSPPPDKIVQSLIDDGSITTEQAKLCRQIPIAADVTAEADSGGHTDNRPLVTLLPTFLSLARQLQDQFNYETAPRIGAAGGISTPGSAAAAFTMGAAWVVIGSIAQAAIESGSSRVVRGMLAQVRQAEITMAPAADMFEMGVNVQVMKRGTLFPMRARKLYETYRKYNSFDEIPIKDRTQLEKTIFRVSLDDAWLRTQSFWSQRDPSQVNRAERNSRHKMALTFRWYLGLSSRWANAGDLNRVADYQIWCGPAMSAFNQWVKGSILEAPHERTIEKMCMNILWGATVINRANQLRNHGFAVPQSIMDIQPQSLEKIFQFIGKERI
ncbi:PfaD family polyunsaturated fatty acid/polyketide biosynthesis protein [bacterium]|nr:PfaD family polyunsaturated fatty acid/polyketide biosynthesis protein [bacterium]